MWVGYNVVCTMGLFWGHSAWQKDRPSNGSMWNSYSFQPIGPWMGYSFTDLGAEGCCQSLNALLFNDIYASLSLNELNHIGLRLEYMRRMRSIPWLLMPWRFVSPGHQHPWYWLLVPCLPWEKNLITSANLISRNHKTCKCIFMICQTNSAHIGLIHPHNDCIMLY